MQHEGRFRGNSTEIRKRIEPLSHPIPPAQELYPASSSSTESYLRRNSLPKVIGVVLPITSSRADQRIKRVANFEIHSILPYTICCKPEKQTGNSMDSLLRTNDSAEQTRRSSLYSFNVLSNSYNQINHLITSLRIQLMRRHELTSDQPHT